MKTRVYYNSKKDKYFSQVRILFFWINIEEYSIGVWDESDAINICKKFEKDHQEYLARSKKMSKVVWTNSQHED